MINERVLWRGGSKCLSAVTAIAVAIYLYLLGSPSKASEEQIPGHVAAVSATDDFLPSRFLTSRGLPGMEMGAPPINNPVTSQATVEKPSGISGELYTVVAPIFLGGAPDGGNTSFLRFFNDSGHNTTFKINVVAFKTDSTTDSSASSLGSLTLTVPDSASLQYSANEILSTIGWGSIACPVACLEHAYQGVGFYLTSTDISTAYQHVIYNPNSHFFENMTICGDKSYSDGRIFGSWMNLINVHTSRLADYPAYIILHNYSTGNRRYGFLFYDARAGIGSPPVAVVIKNTLANSSYTIPMSWFEGEAKWAPAESQLHLNAVIVEYDLNGSRAIGEIKATAGLLIYNSALQSFVNMTQTCQLLHRSANVP